MGMYKHTPQFVIGADGALGYEYGNKQIGLVGSSTAPVSVTASRNLTIFDADQYLICNSVSPIVLTVLADSVIPWNTSSPTIAVCRVGSGAVTFAAGGGVTLRGDLATPSQYGSKGIVRIGANEWAVIAP